MSQTNTISVIGGSHVSMKSYQLAVELGREIANRKYVVITGGRTGVMEAVSKGVQEVGGYSIGILPGESKQDANPFVHAIIPTGLGDARNIIVIRAGDGVIALEGGYGTVSEIAFAKILNKPIVVLKGNGELTELLNTSLFQEIPQVETPIQAVQQIIALIEMDIR